jgi:dTDP-4-amino-4,6-dideoxygalactose transaminase
MRRRNARVYTNLLRNSPKLICPYEAAYANHVYHIYALQTKHRDKLRAYLQKNGIAALIHYPIPLHLQPAYRELGYKRGDFPVAEKTARRIISLPMHPELSGRQIQYVSRKILQFLN